MIKQCKTCMNREFKDKLTCCAIADLFHAFRELLKLIPFFGKDIKTYECGSYMADNRLTGFPDTMHPMCGCSFEYIIAAVDDEIERGKKEVKRIRM